MIIQHMTALRGHPGPSAALLDGAARLPQLGVISACGEEAADFLHRQLTQDIAGMAPGQSGLAALCSAKGRVLADLTVIHHAGGEFFLVVAADLLPVALKLLVMYRLRAHVELDDASADWSVWGAIGAATQVACMATEHALTAPLAPADGAARALCLRRPGAPVAGAPRLSADEWEFAQVRSGVAALSAPVSGAFTPQMLNYESAGLIHFGKGCYPGQEVIARTQFRGAVKRRAYVGHVAGAARAGDNVFLSVDNGEPCGLIAQAAPAPGGGTAVIASIKTAAVDGSAGIAIGSAQGPALRDLFIPYALQKI